MSGELVAQVIQLYKKPPKYGTYISMSRLGTPCERDIYLSFRWAMKESFDDEMYRIFDQGFKIEAKCLEDLHRLIPDLATLDAEGNQDFVKGEDMLKHLCGALDALAPTGAIEEATLGKRTVIDVKSAKSDKWDKMVKDGVKAVHPEYLDQVILYCGYRQAEVGLLLIENKDNAKLHAEVVPFSPERFELLKKRAYAIITRMRLPRRRFFEGERMSPCKFCSKKDICAGKKAADKNCRTCKYAEPNNGGYWTCTKFDKPIKKEFAEVGCESHEYLAGLDGKGAA